MDTRDLGPDSLVVEAASNEGYMVRHFADRGIPVLGIDPAEGPAKAAEEAGVRTLNTFFTADLAKKIRAELDRLDYFRDFTERVRNVKSSLMKLVCP